MLSPVQIDAAVRVLAEDPAPQRIILFGSYATGAQHEDSDLDLLVIEREVLDRSRETTRLKRLLRPLRIPTDLIVVAQNELPRLSAHSDTAVYWAIREGRTVYERC